MASKLSYSIWRPNKSGNGFAATFDYSDKNRCWFAALAPQSGDGERSFDFSKKITAKLGLSDIGAMLSVLLGRTQTVGEKGLFHTSNKDSKDSTIIHLQANENGGFAFSLSQKRGTVSSRGGVNFFLGDAVILAELFRQTVVPMCTEEYTPGGAGNNKQSD